MSKNSLKKAFHVLAEQAARQAVTDERPLQYFRGATALYDMRRDEIVTELPAFDKAREKLGALQMVQQRYGSSHEWERLTLQFIYGFLGDLSEPLFDSHAFEATWEAFWKELSEPEWTWLGLANVKNFQSETLLLELGKGITIRGRSYQELSEMGWSEGQLEQLSREWYEGRVNSSHVILTEHKLPKVPENFVLTDGTVYQKAVRTIGALRLLKDGDIAMGQMLLLRPVSFDLGLGGGTAAMGFPAGGHIAWGRKYGLEESELPSVRDLYDALLRYDSAPDRAYVNLNLALRSFSDIYDRQSLWRDDTRLVDAITAVEALLGTTNEVTFRLAFRVAMILGSDDDERIRIFDQMRSYYDTRSSVVHGGSRLYDKLGQLRAKPRKYLKNQRDLRDIVRRLLVGFLNLTLASGNSYNSAFFDEELDRSLIHSKSRLELRKAMGLE